MWAERAFECHVSVLLIAVRKCDLASTVKSVSPKEVSQKKKKVEFFLRGVRWFMISCDLRIVVFFLELSAVTHPPRPGGPPRKHTQACSWLIGRVSFTELLEQSRVSRRNPLCETGARLWHDEASRSLHIFSVIHLTERYRICTLFY